MTVAASGARLPGGSRLGAVSSFGFSGTNVHMILEQAPEVPALATEIPERPIHVLTASARDATALRQVAEARRRELASGVENLADIAHAANAGRAHFATRLSLTAANSSEAIAQLDAYLGGQAKAGVNAGKAPTRQPKIGFLFTGQGSQYVDMARTLYDAHPVFRAALDRCDEILGDKLPQRLLSVIYPASGETSLIDDTAFTQPALFAVEYALAELWASWGVRPSMVMGHSVGEYVAACVAGVLSVKDALELIAERGRLMGSLPRDGAMVAVMADPSYVAQAVKPFSADVSIAAVNGPRNIVISGREQGIAALLAQFEREGVSATRLKVSHAFHSPLMAPIADALATAASKVAFAPPSIDLVSNPTGGLADATTFNSSYWRKQLLSPVQFAPGVGVMLAAGCTTFIEIGPHPTLIAMGRQCAPDANVVWASSLRRGGDDWRQLLDAAAMLYTGGVNIDWRGFDAPWRRRRVTLATYPFQRSRYWVDPVAPAVPAARAAPTRVAPDDLPRHLRSMLHEVTWLESPKNGGGLLDTQAVSQAVEPLLELARKRKQARCLRRFRRGPRPAGHPLHCSRPCRSRFCLVRRCPLRQRNIAKTVARSGSSQSSLRSDARHPRRGRASGAH